MIIGVSASLAPSRPNSPMMSFTCRGSGDVRMPASVHWTLQINMMIPLASFGPAPSINSRISLRFRREFRTASTSDLCPESRMSSPCTTPAWRLARTFRHLSNHCHPNRLDIFLHLTLPRPCSFLFLFRASTVSISRSILSGCRCRNGKAS